MSSFDFFSEVNSTIRFAEGGPLTSAPWLLQGFVERSKRVRYSVEQLKSGNITMDSLAVEVLLQPYYD